MNTPEETTADEHKPSIRSYLTLRMRDYGILLALIVIIAFFQVVTDGVLMRPGRGRLRASGHGIQGVGQFLNDPVRLQRVYFRLHIRQGRHQGMDDARVAADRAFDERKRGGLPPGPGLGQGVADHIGAQIQHAETKAVFGPGMAVMQLVRMQDHDMARQAVFLGPAIAEALHAFDRIADGVSIVPVRRIGEAREIGFVPFHTRWAGAVTHPVPPRGTAGNARTFKTDVECAC